MRRRHPLPALLLAITGLAWHVADASPLDDGRREFQAAYAVAAAPPSDGAVADSEALRNYPLYPYLQAARLRARVDDPAATSAISAFLQQYGSDPVARSLRRSWLMSLSERKAWEPYLAAYREDVDDTMAATCNALVARIALAKVLAGASGALVGRGIAVALARWRQLDAVDFGAATVAEVHAAMRRCFAAERALWLVLEPAPNPVPPRR